MTVYVKSGGAWRAASNGRLWMKSGGAWRVANYCYIKSGGAWRDSGYRGYPATPSDISIGSNDFNNTWVNVAAGSGGAPVYRYLIQELDYYGNYMTQKYTDPGGTSQYFPVSMDQTIQFRVLAESSAGMQSGWYGPVGGRSRIVIGHTQLSHVQARTSQRAWHAEVGFTCHRDEVYQFYIPTNLLVTQRHFAFHLNFGGSYISAVPGPNNRQLYWVNWSAQSDFMPVPGHDNDVYNTDQFWGQNQNHGFLSRGIGWTQAGNDAQVVYGGMYFDGLESYDDPYTVIDRNYQGNYLW